MKRGKGIATIIVGGLAPPKGEDGETAETEESAEDEYEMAASEIIDAVKEGDAAGLKASLKGFIEMCLLDKEGEKEGAEEDSSEESEDKPEAYE